jgi:hypothetical protein
MRFIHLIIFSNFIQVLNSARELYTKNQYFSNSKLFSTNSLLEKRRLNPRNYSEQEKNVINFVYTNYHGVHMYAKIQCVKLYIFL